MPKRVVLIEEEDFRAVQAKLGSIRYNVNCMEGGYYRNEALRHLEELETLLNINE